MSSNATVPKAKVSSHPFIRWWQTELRDERTRQKVFREYVERLTVFLLYEALSEMPVEKRKVWTPLDVSYLGVKPAITIGFAPIIRAGLGMAEAVSRFFPGFPVFHLGLQRDEATAEAQWYYRKLPEGKPVDWAVILDCMLATGGSAIAAVKELKKWGVKEVSFVGLVGSKEGVCALNAVYPDVDIVLAALDPELNSKKYIVPGLGDAGDRQFGT